MNSKLSWTILLINSLLATVTSMPTFGEKLYKWVDEKGVIHYADQLTPEADKRGNTEISPRGTVLKRTDAALTIEQERALEIEKERYQAERRRSDTQRRKDRALLASYLNENDLEIVRKKNLLGPETAIQLAQLHIENLKKEREKIIYEQRFSASAPKVRINSTLTSIDVEISAYEATILEKTKEIEEINIRFDADLKRWRELQINPLKPLGIDAEISSKTSKPK